MKNCLFILLLFVCKSAFSQLNDNFSDGNFSSNPPWKGDVNAFFINSNAQLQTKLSPDAQLLSLSTESHMATSVRWEFLVRLDFDPSTSNRLRVYLISDKENLKDSLQGYFIQIGEAGNVDSYDLYRQSGTSLVKIFNGPDQVRLISDQLICRIRVARNDDGDWQLSSDNKGGYNFKADGAVTDDTFVQSGWFGAVCLSTSTRSDKFYLDDFKIEAWQSNVSPPYEVRQNEIVINEIFADPEPSVHLPDAEFIELWNRSTENILLKNWIYSDASSTYKFGKDSIQAGEHLILCARADTNKFKGLGRVLGISPWPALNNASDQLSLKDQKGRIINDVLYSDSWYRDTKKKDGGWALELVDPESICAGMKNWKVSVDTTGGTPGRINSVYKTFDSAEPLKITKLVLLDSLSLWITFNRYTDSTSATDHNNYSLNNGGKLAAAYYSSTDPLTIVLKLAEPLARGNSYTVSLSRIADCSGTIITPAFSSASIVLTKEILHGDILISEILFNPRAGGVDFVEIYNNSGQPLNLQELSIGNLPLPDTLKRSKRLSSDQLLLKPGEYLVLTAEPDKVKAEYFTPSPEAFLRVSPFPSYNNDQGLVIIQRDTKLIDGFSYSEKMHSPIIKDPDGISLERSNFQKPAGDPDNFRSAAAAVGFASPGYKNSRYQEVVSEDQFTLVSATFSPDNDGFEDLMQIRYLLSDNDYVANVTIYNSYGNIVRQLHRNFTLGTEGVLEWDGRNDSSELISAGIYLLYAELFTTAGELKKFRKTVILAKKLNED